MDYYADKKTWYLKKYWPCAHADLFVPNGWVKKEDFIPQVNSLSLLIGRGGKIIDLGCGNGLLLKLLRERVGPKLIPYGIDLMENSIRQARQAVLPKFKNNFTVANVQDHVFRGKFDFILLDPECLADQDFPDCFAKCLRALKKNGRLILYSYNVDRLERRRAVVRFLRSTPLRRVALDRVFGYMDKNRGTDPMTRTPDPRLQSPEKKLTPFGG